MKKKFQMAQKAKEMWKKARKLFLYLPCIYPYINWVFGAYLGGAIGAKQDCLESTFVDIFRGLGVREEESL